MSDNKGFSVLAFRWVAYYYKFISVVEGVKKRISLVSLRPKKSDVSTDGNKVKLRKGIKGRTFLIGAGEFFD